MEKPMCPCGRYHRAPGGKRKDGSRRYLTLCFSCKREKYGKDRHNERVRLYRQSIRDKVFAHYGGKCACCKEDEPLFLAVDHVENDGCTDRRAQRRLGADMHLWLVKHNFPEGFQLLCHNCNVGKHLNGGICPHVNGRDDRI